jgi:hypothetical protein
MSMPTTPMTANPYKSDVIQSSSHAHLTPEQIARAVARHQREHPNKTRQPMKTAPRG